MPGSHVNEDGAGLHGHAAWIIDGATGVSDRKLTSGGSDAAWLAGTIDERLTHLASNGGSEHFDHLEHSIRGAFEAETAYADLPGDEHAPSACLGFLRLLERSASGLLRLEGHFLGDVVALVPTENGIVRWTDERSKPFERRTLAALEGASREPGAMPEAVRRQIQENRTRLNHPEGYWVVNPRRPWAGRQLRFEAAIAPGQPVVLATDGFMRLVDVFAAYSDSSIHAGLSAGEGERLMQELRKREREDAWAGLYPRVKIHDDATVLVVAPEHE
ncbi:hypothetical protein [Microvirga subterranea]|uniref:hypothetical protein n=1 Tax=Microvirga subterranea TaxID=186651 RepID=UPI0011C066C4|nr:hypothetical protein [Microvirga subterranea]